MIYDNVVRFNPELVDRHRSFDKQERRLKKAHSIKILTKDDLEFFDNLDTERALKGQQQFLGENGLNLR